MKEENLNKKNIISAFSQHNGDYYDLVLRFRYTTVT